MQLIKFESTDNLPAYLTTGDTSLLDINKEVIRAASFPSLSIKGKQFTISKDGIKRIITKPDDADEVAQSIGVVFLRANMNAKVFYAKKYSEGDSDGARPTCYSYDGAQPSENAMEPQAKKCAVCPHNQWGAKVSDDGEAKGKACSDHARIAVSAPDNLDPMLLRVPPASLKNLREALKVIAARKLPYNAVVMKIAFDREAPSPKLTFKPVGLVDDAGYTQVKELYDGETVRAITGLDDFGHGDTPSKPEAPRAEADELDAALAARAAVKKAAEVKPTKMDEDELDDLLAPKAKPEPAVKAEKAAPKPKREEPPAPKVEKTSASENLLSDLDDLLGNKDD